VLVHLPVAFQTAVARGGFRVVRWPDDPSEQAAFLDLEGPRIEAAVTTGVSGLPEAIMHVVSRLRLICCVGAGYEAFDPHALAARGVQLVNGGQLNADDVADLAFGLFIAVQRRLLHGDKLVRTGNWSKSRLTTHRIRGRNCGILGLGAIGRAVANRAVAFGMNVAWSGRSPKPDEKFQQFADPVRLASWSQALFVCCPLTPQTRGLVGCDLLQALGPDGYLINVARGGVVDEPALLRALQAGLIAGAGLDVFTKEPTDAGDWAALDNVVLHPHAGGATYEALEEAQALAVGNLQRFFANEAVHTPIN
jgi:lactate dehydrogenase-like 2-hydroxyacid dehydrogenase